MSALALGSPARGLALTTLCVMVMGEPHIAGQAHAVHALLNLNSPDAGPFPSDWFTLRDNSQQTRRRIDLPMPDCLERPSDCEDVEVINTLDGFNLQPRLSVPFDGPIDVTTVTSRTLFLIELAETERRRHNERCDDGECDASHVVGINQIVWDPVANTLYVESEELLEQTARYALIATRGIHDAAGREVQASEAFRQFRQTIHGEYRRALLRALHAAHQIGVPERDVVTASVFSTQSATAVMERIRDQIYAALPPAPADFGLGPGDARTVFPFDQVTGITWSAQTGEDPPRFTQSQVNVDLARIIPGAVAEIAFGKYTSPDYEVHPGEFIPPIGTRTGTPTVQGENQIYFNLFVPSGSRPADGWPVAIFGHGNGQTKDSAFNLAAAMAAHGIATIAINAVGHGRGPLGTLTVNLTSGQAVTLWAGGRGIDQDHDHEIGTNEGLISPRPRKIIFFTDGLRQTAADLLQLVRLIQVGVDVHGDGSRDLDPSRIYYCGASAGGNYGTIFLAVDPNVRVAEFSSPGTPIIQNNSWSPLSRTPFGSLLAEREPALLNAPGIVTMEGLATGSPRFNENVPLRDGVPLHVQLEDGTSAVIRSPVINTVAGALEIQQVMKNIEWVGQQGVSGSFAPHLRQNPLPGMNTKSVIYQFARTDPFAPPPVTMAIVRAGDLADHTIYYRHDLAHIDHPTVGNNPHALLIRTDIPGLRSIALSLQEQVATFFESDGATIIQPEPARYFEAPIVLPLPVALEFNLDP
jgi:hypothetical protein